MCSPPLVYLVAGARPNFMKLAPIVRAVQAEPALRFKIIHTGQHYDRDMSGVFFDELGIPAPDVRMHIAAAGHAGQTAQIMVGFEQLCLAERPALVLVAGDVNSTLACAITAKKLAIPLAHVEAGLRSGDMAMPEEINRIVTDSISDWLFATEASAVQNLLREGKAAAAIHEVGHVMADNVLYQLDRLHQLSGAATSALAGDSWKRARMREGGRYGVVTLHRAGNVDEPAVLCRLGDALRALGGSLPLIFPVHPRTRSRLAGFGIDLGPNVALVAPLGYMAFLNLWKDAAVVLTDSGGLQEETTVLGVPCITLRDSTERPVTVEQGSNVLAGTDPARIGEAAHAVLRGQARSGRRPPLWDGAAAVRIVTVLASALR